MSDDRFDARRYHNEDTFSIQSTAGAVPVKNKKGEISMQKVKVQRYVSGKRPEYARGVRDEDSESESSDEEDFTSQRRSHHHGRHQREYQESPERMEDDEHQDEEEEGVQAFKTEEFDGPSVAIKEEEDVDDPRLRRLRAAKTREPEPDENSDDDRISRHRRIHEPEVLSDGEEASQDAVMES